MSGEEMGEMSEGHVLQGAWTLQRWPLACRGIAFVTLQSLLQHRIIRVLLLELG